MTKTIDCWMCSQVHAVGKHVPMMYEEARALTDQIRIMPRRSPPLKRTGPQPSQLYRCFDKDGQLLYVGISLSIAARMGQHRNEARWWFVVTNIHVTRFTNREQARLAELEAIRTEFPLFNRADKPKVTGAPCDHEPVTVIVCADCGRRLE